MTASVPTTLFGTRELERAHATGAVAHRDIAIVRGLGATVWAEDGRAYVDCTSGHGVASLGHCHPRVAEAVARQASTLITCAQSFPNDRRAELLARLVRILPDDLSRIFLSNSGAEAVEGAIKLARLSTGRTGVVAAMRGFHGRTCGALSATWERRYREPFAPLLPDVAHVPFDDLDAAEAAISERTAAVLIEIVQGEGGVRPGSTAYFSGLRRLCDERGALFVVDEVQTGFGRTGRWFACEHHGVVPDVLCLGKAIAGGVPMGATALGRRVGPVPAGAHGSTFGGNPLACAAALAALDAFEAEGLVARAAELGAYLLSRLAAIRSPLLREVRGLGLMAGVELRARVAPLLDRLQARGVLALSAGPTVLRLLPPLVITREELDVAVDAVEASLAQGGEG
jgi:acetylornithine/LysW-gamma-L-lysine aminotransferase